MAFADDVVGHAQSFGRNFDAFRADRPFTEESGADAVAIVLDEGRRIIDVAESLRIVATRS